MNILCPFRQTGLKVQGYGVNTLIGRIQEVSNVADQMINHDYSCLYGEHPIMFLLPTNDGGS